MSQRDNYDHGKGCLGVAVLLMAVLLAVGFAAKNLHGEFARLNFN